MENDDLELACGCKHSSLSKFYLSHSFTVGNATRLLELQGGKPDSASLPNKDGLFPVHIWSYSSISSVSPFWPGTYCSLAVLGQKAVLLDMCKQPGLPPCPSTSQWKPSLKAGNWKHTNKSPSQRLCDLLRALNETGEAESSRSTHCPAGSPAATRRHSPTAGPGTKSSPPRNKGNSSLMQLHHNVCYAEDVPGPNDLKYNNFQVK